MTGTLPAAVRRRALAGPQVRPPGPWTRVAVLLATVEMLVYAGEKVCMAAIGKIGMPRAVAPDSVQAGFTHPSLAQAGNATLGVVAALLAVTTLAPWVARVPRWAMLVALGGAALAGGTGAVLTLSGPSARPDPCSSRSPLSSRSPGPW